MMAQGAFNVGGATPPPIPGVAVAAAAPAAAPILDILTPAQVAQTLGVTEGDVISSIESGDIKAKKIGSQYRITKAALDEFLAH
jgi:excisionase family DNA binding protein